MTKIDRAMNFGPKRVARSISGGLAGQIFVVRDILLPERSDSLQAWKEPPGRKTPAEPLGLPTPREAKR